MTRKRERLERPRTLSEFLGFYRLERLRALTSAAGLAHVLPLPWREIISLLVLFSLASRRLRLRRH